MEEELIDSSSFVKLSSYRGLLYNLFSRVFARKADREFLESLTAQEIINIVGGVCENAEAAGRLKGTIKDVLLQADTFFKIKEGFDGLFVIPVSGRFIPPYISYYLGNESKRINIGTTGAGAGAGRGRGADAGEGDIALIDRLEFTYNSLNFTLKDTKGISLKRPDHISYIFGFMAALVNLEEKYQTGQVKNPLPFQEVISNEFSFFNEFIISWINLFADEVIERADSPFYTEMARLMQSFVSSEQRDFKSLLLQN